MKKKTIVFSLILIFLFPSFSYMLIFIVVDFNNGSKLKDILNNELELKSKIPEISPVSVPINITGNAEMDSFFASSPNDGLSWDSAYVLDNYQINGSKLNGDNACINISDTSRFLIIRNCRLFGRYASDGNIGLSLTNCKNIQIDDCSIINNGNGIYIIDTQ